MLSIEDGYMVKWNRYINHFTNKFQRKYPNIPKPMLTFLILYW